jgi:hypothetical protein
MLPRMIRAALVVSLGMSLAQAMAAPSENELPFFHPPVACFPPSVPIFGEEIANHVPVGPDAVRLKPPSALADYVCEYFYPALSTRLLNGSLSQRMLTRLEEYRATRAKLINELADKLVALHNADDATRVTELRAFAEQQNPRIVALEREAEDLRRDLVSGGLLNFNVDWSAQRTWRVGGTPFSTDIHAREAEFQTVRAAAFYQDELLPEQRGLLLEATAELRVRARAARPIPPPKKDDPTGMFFSPATARLRLPPKMPPELVTKIGRYNQLKAALKQQLVSAVWRYDAMDFYDRRRAFRRLADEQWPRFAELEELADEIRRDLAALPPTKLIAPPYLPPTLVTRIESYLTDGRRYMEEFNETMRVASRMVPPPVLDPSMPPDERRRRIRDYEVQRAKLREQVAKAFEEETKDRFLELRQRYERIRDDLKEVAVGQRDPDTGRPLDADGLLRTYSVAMERFATFGREEVIYRGYRTAMLLEGLSREQRRLLFGAALNGLAQPLPFGEPLPRVSQPLPVPRA